MHESLVALLADSVRGEEALSVPYSFELQAVVTSLRIAQRCQTLLVASPGHGG
ncbi:hypothetical protein [Massilia sp. YMA4]|uniref:hypothetical protein n=1 Tax=Massilia sp. YMA4 TaxID=1593482 RepID=UPI001877AE82|nr:hypothetical protein [Massilia sp. YMA4]